QRSRRWCEFTGRLGGHDHVVLVLGVPQQAERGEVEPQTSPQRAARHDVPAVAGHASRPHVSGGFRALTGRNGCVARPVDILVVGVCRLASAAVSAASSGDPGGEDKCWGPTSRDLSRKGQEGKEAHRIVQDAAVRELPDTIATTLPRSCWKGRRESGARSTTLPLNGNAGTAEALLAKNSKSRLRRSWKPTCL